MRPEERAQFDKAVGLVNAGSSESAIPIFKSILQSTPNDVVTLVALGGVFMELEHNEEAIWAFEKASKLKPEAEMISVGLFHCYWQAGMYDQAFQEMRRFVSLKYSAEYALILGGFSSSG